jgi:hypothetical protein
MNAEVTMRAMPRADYTKEPSNSAGDEPGSRPARSRPQPLAKRLGLSATEAGGKSARPKHTVALGKRLDQGARLSWPATRSRRSRLVPGGGTVRTGYV